MLRIFNSLQLIAYYASHVRHHHHAHEKRQPIQMEVPLKPYEYFLRYTYPPLGTAIMSTDDIENIQPNEITSYFKRLIYKESENRLNYPLIQKFAKVRIILVYLQARHSWHGFSFKANRLFQSINNSFNDHKYSQIYEQGIISKLVENFRDYQLVEIDVNSNDICRLLERILLYNEKMQDQMNQICQRMNLEWNEQSKIHKLRDLTISKPFERKPVPERLFQIINEVYQYSKVYNTFKLDQRRLSYLSPQFMAKSLQNIMKNADEYAKIIAGQIRFFDNVKLTKWDYLISIQFILSQGHYNPYTFHRIRDYIDDNRELCKKSSYLTGGSILFQSLLLCNILQHLVRNIEQYKDSPEKKMLRSRITPSYQFYLSTFAQCLKKLTFEQLQNALSNHFKIFQRYLLITFDDEETLRDYKQIYFKLFNRILDYNENGILLIESSKDVNFIFEAILSMFTLEDQEKVLTLIQKYENLLMLNPRFLENKVVYNYRAAYLVCLKYNFKSDIFASKILSTIELKQWTKQKVVAPRNGKQIPQISSVFNDIFNYFLYLNLIETKSSISEQIQQLWQAAFLNLKMSQFENSPTIISDRKERPATRRIFLDELQKNKTFVKTFRISSLNILLLMMQKGLQKEQWKEIIENKFIMFCQRQKLIKMIQNHISFPNVYYHFINIADKLQCNDQKTIKVVNSIRQIVEQESKIKETPPLKVDQNIYYQQFNDLVQGFPVKVSNMDSYRINKFHYLHDLNKEIKHQEITSKTTEQESLFTKEQAQSVLKAIIQSHKNQQTQDKPAKQIKNNKQLRYFQKDYLSNSSQSTSTSKDKKQESKNIEGRTNDEPIISQSQQASFQHEFQQNEQKGQQKSFFRALQKQKDQKNEAEQKLISKKQCYSQRKQKLIQKQEQHDLADILLCTQKLSLFLIELKKLKAQTYTQNFTDILQPSPQQNDKKTKVPKKKTQRKKSELQNKINNLQSSKMISKK